MPYGVIVSTSASVAVEATSGMDGTAGDLALDLFSRIWGPAPVTGRLTLTRLHLSFVPHRAGRGIAMMHVHLRDVERVERSGGRWSARVGLRSGSHLVQVRSLGSAGLGTQIAGLATAARGLPPRPA